MVHEHLPQAPGTPERVVEVHCTPAREHEYVGDTVLDEQAGDQIGDAHLGHGDFRQPP
jgi:hypothetical protein